ILAVSPAESLFFFFQAEDGIRDFHVTGVQTCALPISFSPSDLCPDNVMINNDGARFLDYEWGGFRDATLDISYALVSFPGCLCRSEERRVGKECRSGWAPCGQREKEGAGGRQE